MSKVLKFKNQVMQRRIMLCREALDRYDLKGAEKILRDLSYKIKTKYLN